MNATADKAGVPGQSDMTGAASRPMTVSFTIRCGARHAYLCLAGEKRTRRLLEPMTPGEGGEWRSNVQLEPGTYRYRYYVEDGDRTLYFSPLDEAGERCPVMDGLDAVLRVPPVARTRRQAGGGRLPAAGLN